MIKLPSNEVYKGIIGVCGASKINDETYQIAENLGKEIAKNKFILVCGGFFGAMEAVSKGVKSGGGFTIGIIPTSNKKDANSYIDLVIPTGMGEARNLILINTADAIISISGKAGTLSEIALAWRERKPIVALQTTGGWSSKLAGLKIDDTRSDKILSANTPKEAVEKIMKLLKFF